MATRHTPTHTGVIIMKFNAFVVRLCLLILACLIVAGATLVMKLNSDCRATSSYHVNVFGYEGSFVFKKTAESCRQ